MPCFHPLQAFYSVRPDGKKRVLFSKALAKLFDEGVPFSKDDTLQIPCGRCMGCRLERSRQWAVRCMHEASLYEENCFLTLTYDDAHLPPSASLRPADFKLFMKRLRKHFSDRKIRVFYCGEYGDSLGRPHFHCCLFNLEFKDKVYFKSVNGQPLFVSGILSGLWGNGYSVIGDLTFESAAYVARYCTKKVTGKQASDFYGGKVPEFAHMSLKPGIAKGWYDRWKGDVFPSDFLVVNGVKCKPPRYYDKLSQGDSPSSFERVRELRRVRALAREDDGSHRRLLVRERCQAARFKKLVRVLECS